MTNYDLLNQEKDKECERCKKPASYTINNLCYRCACCGSDNVQKVSDLTVEEYKDLMVDCFEMLKQREIDTSEKEYKRLTEKSGGGNV